MSKLRFYALSALAELKHPNKLIGIISHMAALKDYKEMMGCQIRIISQQGGKSILEGSGVSR